MRLEKEKGVLKKGSRESVEHRGHRSGKGSKGNGKVGQGDRGKEAGKEDQPKQV